MKLPPRLLALVVAGIVAPTVVGCGKQRFSKPESAPVVEATPTDETAIQNIDVNDGGAPKPRPDPCPACGMG
jgi:hypothetical protein